MPRIPDTEIDRLKASLDLAALVRSRGIDLKPHGNGHLIGLCPFHDDKGTPNLVVTPGKGLFHCLACGAAGNGIQFVQKFDGISFRHAFELLDEGGQAAFAKTSEGPMKRTTVPKLENPLDAKSGDPDLFAQVIDYYHERLYKNPAALEYLESRGLKDPDALNRFRIGFGLPSGAVLARWRAEGARLAGSSFVGARPPRRTPVPDLAGSWRNAAGPLPHNG